MDKLGNKELIELIKVYISKDEEEKQSQKNNEENKKDILMKNKFKDINDFIFIDFVDYVRINNKFK